jgi:sulfane dehydrogenase subunit SoxC
MSAKNSSRRQFLRNGAALAAVVAGAAAAKSVGAQGGGQMPENWNIQPLDTPESRETALNGTPGLAQGQQFDAIYGVRSRFVTSGRIGGIGAYYTGPDGKAVRPYLGSLTPIQDLRGAITPAPLHYFLSHGYIPPDIDPAEHRLLVHGMVDRPKVFTMEDIYRLPSVTHAHFLECNGNGYMNAMRKSPDATAQNTHGLTSCSIWTGVRASTIMELVGAQKSGTWIVAEGAEGAHHSKSIPMWKVMDDAILVYAQNGEPVRPEQGFPLRFLAPGFEAINSIKYLRRIKVVDSPYFQQRETTGYQTVITEGDYNDGKARWFQFELGPKSVIARPSGGMRMGNPGYYEVTGLAWSGAAAIRRAEISTDNGKTWKDAELQGPVVPKAHTRFVFPWTWDGQETVLLSRSTDERGQVQPSLAEIGKLWGVSETYLQTHQVGHTNAIQPWRVKADGRVYNAIV